MLNVLKHNALSTKPAPTHNAQQANAEASACKRCAEAQCTYSSNATTVLKHSKHMQKQAPAKRVLKHSKRMQKQSHAKTVL